MFTVLELLQRTTARAPHKEVVWSRAGRLTFQELLIGSRRFAARLREQGVRRGDRVGILMRKSPEQVLALIAVLDAGAIVVPILPRLKQANIAHIIADSGLNVLIVDPSLGSAIPAQAATRIIVMERSATPDLIARQSDGLPDDDGPLHGNADGTANVVSADPAAIIYTSGSTGRPKGVVVTHRNLHDGALITSGYLGTTSSDRVASVLGLEFDYGMNQLWQAVATGATLCLHEYSLPGPFFAFLRERRITALPLMPALAHRIFDSRSGLEDVFDDVRYVSSSGAPVSQQMLERLQQSFPAADIYSMYGLTEAFRSTYLPPGQLLQRPTSIGLPIPDVEVLVLDEHLAEAPPGQVGELVHRGACVAQGYWNAPEATAERFRPVPGYPGELLVFSGDLVRRDAEGFLYFVGRKDAMIKTSGFRVSPTEVEEAAQSFASVTGCVAFGVPSEALGEVIGLTYVSTEPLVEAALLAFLRRELPSHMVPSYLLPRDTLPMAPGGGKVDRATVIAEALNELRLCDGC